MSSFFCDIKNSNHNVSKLQIYISNFCLGLCQNLYSEQHAYQLHAEMFRPQKHNDLHYHRQCL
uniref:Uncharacterized protein n=1 Tax=Arundo donax TaxID=35708 RepID=A0A0A9F6F7_ARUDO